jgi:hypothetical protein
LWQSDEVAAHHDEEVDGVDAAEDEQRKTRFAIRLLGKILKRIVVIAQSPIPFPGIQHSILGGALQLLLSPALGLGIIDGPQKIFR